MLLSMLHFTWQCMVRGGVTAHVGVGVNVHVAFHTAVHNERWCCSPFGISGGCA